MKPYENFEKYKEKISVIISQKDKQQKNQIPMEQPRVWEQVPEYYKPEPVKKDSERGVFIIQF